MPKKETVSERLDRLLTYWNKVLADSGIIENLPLEETTPKELASKFGLSLSQAKTWLKREPKYPTDEILQRKRTDKDFTEPRFRFCYVFVCFIVSSEACYFSSVYRDYNGNRFSGYYHKSVENAIYAIARNYFFVIVRIISKINNGYTFYCSELPSTFMSIKIF